MDLSPKPPFYRIDWTNNSIEPLRTFVSGVKGFGSGVRVNYDPF